MTAFTDTITAGFGVGGAFTPGYGVSVQSGIGMTSTAIPGWTYGALINEVMRLADVLAPQLAWGVTVQGGLVAQDTVTAGYGVTLSETLRLASVLDPRVGALMVETIALGSTAAPALSWFVSTSEGMAFSASGGFTLSALIVEALRMTQTSATHLNRVVQVVDGVALAHDITPAFMAVAQVSDRIQITQSQVIHMALFGEVVEGVSISAGMRDPGGTTRWAINTRTGAVTEYRGRGFDSYGQLGMRHVGMSRDGLWALEGETDDGAPITSRIRGGVLELNNARLTGLRGVYFGMRTSNENVEHFLKLITGDDHLYVYRFRPRDMETIRVQPARGLRARYFQWELELIGADFAIDEIEFVPMQTARRMGR